MVSRSLIAEAFLFCPVLNLPELDAHFKCTGSPGTPNWLKTLQKCRPKGLPSRQTPVLEDDENDEVFNFFGACGLNRA